ncbi:hypothetical protein GQ457_12G000620 [Hibiscus cannabinus]
MSSCTLSPLRFVPILWLKIGQRHALPAALEQEKCIPHVMLTRVWGKRIIFGYILCASIHTFHLATISQPPFRSIVVCLPSLDMPKQNQTFHNNNNKTSSIYRLRARSTGLALRARSTGSQTAVGREAGKTSCQETPVWG